MMGFNGGVSIPGLEDYRNHAQHSISNYMYIIYMIYFDIYIYVFVYLAIV